jgi:hypothetical protein
MLEIVIQRFSKEVLRRVTESEGVTKARWPTTYETVKLVKAFNVGWESTSILFRDFDLIREET